MTCSTIPARVHLIHGLVTYTSTSVKGRKFSELSENRHPFGKRRPQGLKDYVRVYVRNVGRHQVWTSYLVLRAVKPRREVNRKINGSDGSTGVSGTTSSILHGYEPC